MTIEWLLPTAWLPTAWLPTLAFLAPLPPMRPEPPEPLRGNEWAATVVIGSVCLMMVLPMITIWSFWGPHDSFRVRCEASGGRVVQDPAAGAAPYRCDRGGSAASR